MHSLQRIKTHLKFVFAYLAEIIERLFPPKRATVLFYITLFSSCQSTLVE